MVKSLLLIAYGALKLLNADWLRQGAFLGTQGTFGNQEGMITLS